MKITSFALNNFATEKFFGGRGEQIGDECSKILDCDRIMKAFFVKRNYSRISPIQQQQQQFYLSLTLIHLACTA